MFKKLLLIGCVLIAMISQAQAEIIDLSYTNMGKEEGILFTDDKEKHLNLYIDINESMTDRDEIKQIAKKNEMLPFPIKTKLFYHDMFEVTLNGDINISENSLPYNSKYISKMKKYLQLYSIGDTNLSIMYKHENKEFNTVIIDSYIYNIIGICYNEGTNIFFKIPDDFSKKINDHNIYKIGNYYIFNGNDIHNFLNNYVKNNPNFNDKDISKEIDVFIHRSDALK